MQFSTLCDTYKEISQTTKRLEKTAILAAFLKEVPEREMQTIMLLLKGRVFAEWDKTTLGISEKLTIKAINTASGIPEKEIMTKFKELGDLGEVAAAVMGKKTQVTLTSQELTTADVFAGLQKLATIEGLGSVDQKLKTIAQLLSNASANEARFLIRILLEDLRIGIAEGTIRDGIIWWQLQDRGETYDSEKNEWSTPELVKQWQETVQQAIDRSNDIAKVALTAKEGLSELEKIELILGVPTRVMLAQRSTDIEDAFSRVGKPAAVEEKLDGFRVKIHRGKDIHLFTRRLEDVTAQFPDIVALVKEHITEDCILDCEVVGFDTKTKKHKPFQEISQRIRRKYDIEKLAEELPVQVNVFDILLYKGETVYHKPFVERRALLEQLVPRLELLCPVTQIVTEDLEEAEAFYKQALDKSFEGLMFKTLDAPYKPGSRVGFMVKLKPTLDTLDLAVVGAEWGEGKRSGWLTSFTVACLDEGELVQIGKVGTGFKELEQEGGVTFAFMTDSLKDDITHEEGREVTVKPTLVIEVKFEEVQKSPTYSSGYALRFPRIVRVRSDRRVEEISTLDEVFDLYGAQRGR
ncbi:MAG: ATP-dependent DNA ligase [Candidatus Woesearchaeota archaeon]|nr:ATP-dependent DNA ligase [Candidatus Woesearchaeota archaeon]